MTTHKYLLSKCLSTECIKVIQKPFDRFKKLLIILQVINQKQIFLSIFESSIFQEILLEYIHIFKRQILSIKSSNTRASKGSHSNLALNISNSL